MDVIIYTLVFLLGFISALFCVASGFIDVCWVYNKNKHKDTQTDADMLFEDDSDDNY